jgi:hypothetical protein
MSVFVINDYFLLICQICCCLIQQIYGPKDVVIITEPIFSWDLFNHFIPRSFFHCAFNFLLLPTDMSKIAILEQMNRTGLDGTGQETRLME